MKNWTNTGESNLGSHFFWGRLSHQWRQRSNGPRLRWNMAPWDVAVARRKPVRRWWVDVTEKIGLSWKLRIHGFFEVKFEDAWFRLNCHKSHPVLFQPELIQHQFLGMLEMNTSCCAVATLDAKAGFDHFDVDRNGKIDSAELRQLEVMATYCTQGLLHDCHGKSFSCRWFFNRKKQCSIVFHPIVVNGTSCCKWLLLFHPSTEARHEICRQQQHRWEHQCFTDGSRWTLAPMGRDGVWPCAQHGVANCFSQQAKFQAVARWITISCWMRRSTSLGPSRSSFPSWRPAMLKRYPLHSLHHLLLDGRMRRRFDALGMTAGGLVVYGGVTANAHSLGSRLTLHFV